DGASVNVMPAGAIPGSALSSARLSDALRRLPQIVRALIAISYPWIAVFDGLTGSGPGPRPESKSHTISGAATAARLARDYREDCRDRGRPARLCDGGAVGWISRGVIRASREAGYPACGQPAPIDGPANITIDHGRNNGPDLLGRWGAGTEIGTALFG